MKATIAVTLMMEKTNSASPYALTPNKLMMKMAAKKMATKTDLEMSSFQ